VLRRIQARPGRMPSREADGGLILLAGPAIALPISDCVPLLLSRPPALVRGPCSPRGRPEVTAVRPGPRGDRRHDGWDAELEEPPPSPAAS
jgi:hypothetical protein